jgi:hypothetical protein
MSPRRLSAVLFWTSLALALRGQTPLDARYNQAVVEPVKTSIYIGYVKLSVPMFTRTPGGYVSDYDAAVFPFFFWDEHGRMTIVASDRDLRRLARGEAVDFQGRATNSDGEWRHIEGRAVPTDATRGKLKVRVFVTPRLQLIFNTTYRFVGRP